MALAKVRVRGSGRETRDELLFGKFGFEHNAHNAINAGSDFRSMPRRRTTNAGTSVGRFNP